MDNASFEELKQSIQKIGLKDPIVIYQEKILDGRNRFKACAELGIEPRFEYVNGNTDPLEYVLYKNKDRRHLTPDQLAVVALEVEAIEAERAKERQATSTGGANPQLSANQHQAEKGKAAAKAAKKVGASTRKVQRAKALKKADPKLAEKVKNGEMPLKDAEKKVEQDKKVRERKEKLDNAPTAPVWIGKFETGSIYQADVTKTEFINSLPENSVDLIVTDPPWDKDSLATYEAAAQIAARVLKPGHFMAIYSGKMFLPDILDLLRHSLEYVWTFSVFQPDSNDKIQKYHLYSAWRPVILVKKPGESVDMVWMPDCVKSTRDKRYHEWGQGVELVEKFVQGYSQPGEIVLDPFIGGASVPYVPKMQKRRYIGFDISLEAVRLGLARLENE
jgi:DNA modification methylase/ParB-like chromosome segregation protein Spo0J